MRGALNTDLTEKDCETNGGDSWETINIILNVEHHTKKSDSAKGKNSNVQEKPAQESKVMPIRKKDMTPVEFCENLIKNILQEVYFITEAYFPVPLQMMPKGSSTKFGINQPGDLQYRIRAHLWADVVPLPVNMGSGGYDEVS